MASRLPKASKSAFRDILNRVRKAFRACEDPLGKKDSEEISKKKLERCSLRMKPKLPPSCKARLRTLPDTSGGRDRFNSRDARARVADCTRHSAPDRRRRQRDSAHLQRHQLVHVGRAAALAVSLGLNVFIVRASGQVRRQPLWLASQWRVLGVWFWFGMQLLARRGKGGTAMKMENEQVPVLKKIDQLLTGHA